jgi:cytochrome c553
MKPVHLIVASVMALVVAFGPVVAAEYPSWAYPDDVPDRPVTSSAPVHVPGSRLSLTQDVINNPYFVPDWYPETHPPMPAIVARGREPAIEACGLCHLPIGEGHPESGGLSGESVDYIEGQIADFKAGLRHSPITGKMVAFAKALTPEEAHAAALYFASLKRQKWNRVVEADRMVKVVIGPHGQMLAVPGGGEVPRPYPIVVLQTDPELTEARASKAGFTAYVPVGSLEKGKTFVETGGGGKSIPCALCHGPGLKGAGDTPPIAGRSPLTIFRNLNDFKAGNRGGDRAAPMAAVVANMTSDEMIAIAAYVGSLDP